MSYGSVLNQYWREREQQVGTGNASVCGGVSVGIKRKQVQGVVTCSVICLKPKLSSRFWGQGQWVAIVSHSVTGEGRLMWRADWRIRERREHRTRTPSCEAAGSGASEEGHGAVRGWRHPIAAGRKPVSLWVCEITSLYIESCAGSAANFGHLHREPQLIRCLRYVRKLCCLEAVPLLSCEY